MFYSHIKLPAAQKQLLRAKLQRAVQLIIYHHFSYSSVAVLASLGRVKDMLFFSQAHDSRRVVLIYSGVCCSVLRRSVAT